MPYISDEQPAARRCYVSGPQEFSEHNLCFPIKNKNHFFFSDLVYFASIVKFGKQRLSCNGIHAYYLGTYRSLEILQWEEWEKYEVVKLQHPLLFQVQVCSDKKHSKRISVTTLHYGIMRIPE